MYWLRPAKSLIVFLALALAASSAQASALSCKNLFPSRLEVENQKSMVSQIFTSRTFELRLTYEMLTQANIHPAVQANAIVRQLESVEIDSNSDFAALLALISQMDGVTSSHVMSIVRNRENLAQRMGHLKPREQTSTAPGASAVGESGNSIGVPNPVLEATYLAFMSTDDSLILGEHFSQGRENAQNWVQGSSKFPLLRDFSFNIESIPHQVLVLMSYKMRSMGVIGQYAVAKTAALFDSRSDEIKSYEDAVGTLVESFEILNKIVLEDSLLSYSDKKMYIQSYVDFISSVAEGFTYEVNLSGLDEDLYQLAVEFYNGVKEQHPIRSRTPNASALSTLTDHYFNPPTTLDAPHYLPYSRGKERFNLPRGTDLFRSLMEVEKRLKDLSIILGKRDRERRKNRHPEPRRGGLILI